jgi:hypothetical protein
MYRFTSDGVDVEELRTRLQRMSDTELLRFGTAARNMCSPAANLGKSPREAFVIQLEEARTEWQRRKTERKQLQLVKVASRLAASCLFLHAKTSAFPCLIKYLIPGSQEPRPNMCGVPRNEYQ